MTSGAFFNLLAYFLILQVVFERTQPHLIIASLAHEIRALHCR